MIFKIFLQKSKLLKAIKAVRNKRMTESFHPANNYARLLLRTTKILRWLSKCIWAAAADAVIWAANCVEEERSRQ